MADARKLLDKAVRIAAKELRALAKQQRLDSEASLTLYRLTRVLADVRDSEAEDVKIKRKKLADISTEELEALAGKKVNEA